MNKQSSANWMDWLFRPFTYIAGMQALAIGLTVILLTAGLSMFTNMHNDGIIDVHFGGAPYWVYFVEQLVNITVIFLVLWPLGALLSHSKVRAIDMLGTQAYARFPMILVSLTGLFAPYETLTEKVQESFLSGSFEIEMSTQHWILFGVSVVFMLISIIWMVALMWQGYKISANLKGPKAVISFAAGLLVAEIISKIALKLILQT